MPNASVTYARIFVLCSILLSAGCTRETTVMRYTRFYTLTERAQVPLRRFMQELHVLISDGVAMAVARGDLSPQTAREELAMQLANLINSAGAILEDSGDGFDSLGRLYAAFLRIVQDAYGGFAKPSRTTRRKSSGTLRSARG